MMPVKTHVLFLIFVTAATVPLFTPAQGRGLPNVPASVAEPDHSRLVTQREDLSKERNVLNARIRAFNRQCATAREGSPKAASCRSKDAELSRAKAAYRNHKHLFFEALGHALARSSDSKAVGKITGSGSFALLSRDGKRISGKNFYKILLKKDVSIITGSNGHVRGNLPDGTVFTVGPNAQVLIDEFVYDKRKDDTGTFKGEIKRGVFRWVTGHIGRRRKFHARLGFPDGSLGTRGTDLEIFVARDKSGYVKLFSGVIDLTLATGGNKLTMHQRQILRFDSHGTVSGPLPMEPNDMPKEQ